MTAEIVQDTGTTYPWVGWCEQCHDGVRHNSISRSQQWVDRHNETAHKAASALEEEA